MKGRVKEILKPNYGETKGASFTNMAGAKRNNHPEGNRNGINDSIKEMAGILNLLKQFSGVAERKTMLLKGSKETLPWA